MTQYFYIHIVNRPTAVFNIINNYTYLYFDNNYSAVAERVLRKLDEQNPCNLLNYS